MVGGETIRLQLREDGLSVDGHLKGAATALHGFDLRVGEGLLDFGGQTGRLREVVSLGAVLDANFHSVTPWVLRMGVPGARRVANGPRRVLKFAPSPRT